MEEKIKIPILMYHEVSRGQRAGASHYEMTPSYYVSASDFENQIRHLAEDGYQTILFDEVGSVQSEGKYIILTFDDGWIGNHDIALPILQRYGFKAIFFVTVGSICSPEFMNWKEVGELLQNGMSVQSHGFTHKPLETLSREEVRRELSESRNYIENELGTGVNAISFPHGSFNQQIIEAAEQCGYTIMCTSNVVRTYSGAFRKEPVVLGRIGINNTIDQEKFVRLIEYNFIEILSERISKEAKNMVKKVIGIENYRRLYRRHFNIRLPERTERG